jgi:uncharacterized protein YidB (DUF937 family)
MGFLDEILGQTVGSQGQGSTLGGVLDFVSKNPQILEAVANLLSTRDGTVGGNGGLVEAFRNQGLGDMVAAWISTGPNPPISSAQVSEVLGDDTVGQFAGQAGVPASDAGSILAGLLPVVIDRLTPDGRVPETGSLEKALGSLLSSLG